MQKLLLPLLIALPLVAPQPAFAADPVVLVPTSGGLGSEMPDIAARITETVKTVATKNGLTPKVTDASRDDVFAIAGCNSDDDPCHQAVLRTLGAKKLILVHVSPGTGAATADVEIVVATRGKPPVKLVVSLTSTTTDRMLAELEAKAPPAFGGKETTPTTPTNPTTNPTTDPTNPTSPVDPNNGVEVPKENTTIDGGLNTGEGDPFSNPTGSEEKPISPYDPNPDKPVDQKDPPLGTTEPPAETPEGGGYDFSRVGGLAWGVGGAGAGLVLTSFIFYGLAGSKQDEVNSARVNTVADIERLKDLESSGKTLTNVGNTAFLLGLVGLGVGGYLIYRDAKVPASEQGVAIGPTLLPDGFGIGVVVKR